MCTCQDHYVGNGIYCHPETNLTLKIYSPPFTAAQINFKIREDVATAVLISTDAVAVISVTLHSGLAYVSLRFGLVATEPWLTPTVLVSRLTYALSNSSDGAIGPNQLFFDPVYGVAVDTFNPMASQLLVQLTRVNLTLSAAWNPLLAINGSSARSAFLTDFKQSVATQLSIESARVNILSIVEGSIKVDFQIDDSTAPPSLGPVISTAAALVGFRHLMAGCVNATCPQFGGYTATSFVEEQSTGAASASPIIVDAELESIDLLCYSSEDTRCNQTACSTDADCRSLPGLGDADAAFCFQSLCEDGLGGIVLTSEKSKSSRNGPGPLLFLCALLWSFVFDMITV